MPPGWSPIPSALLAEAEQSPVGRKAVRQPTRLRLTPVGGRGVSPVVVTAEAANTTEFDALFALPTALPPGAYTVQLVNEENPDEVTEEVKTKILEEAPGPCFELDEFTKQLEAEALSRNNSSNNCSEDEDSDRRPSEEWATQ